MISFFMFSVENPEAVFQVQEQSDEEAGWASVKKENNIDYLQSSVY